MTETTISAEKTLKPNPRNKLLASLALVVLVAATLWGGWYYLTQRTKVRTDNAYVGADSAQVTPLVPGTVTEVRVVNTQAVKKGDLLVRLDEADALIAVTTAQAELLQAQQRFAQSLASGESLKARIEARLADVKQAQASFKAAQANFERAKTALQRRKSLIGTGAVADEDLTAANSEFETASANLELARAGINVAIANRASARGDLAVNRVVTHGLTIEDNPDVAAARARLQAAQLNLERTTITAPISGIITQRKAQVGQRIAAGSPIMTIVPIEAVYVDANFKEDKLRNVKLGQPVELTSDYYGSDVVFHGRVAGFAGGTGAAFSLIPAQNATGNWVKVVQRLPVRITLDAEELHQHPLRVGLSMEAVIDTRDYGHRDD